MYDLYPKVLKNLEIAEIECYIGIELWTFMLGVFATQEIAYVDQVEFPTSYKIIGSINVLKIARR